MTRRLLLLAGLGVLALAWSVPFSSFSGHMVQHMSVVAIAAPLLALGIAGGRWDPVRRAEALFPPVPASVLELFVVWSWHTPSLHHAARTQSGAFVAEQASFVLSGLWVWLAAFGGGLSLRAERRGAGVLALLLTSMHMTLLGALLALAQRTLFAHGHAAHGGGWLAPLDDQHLGGAIMLVVGGLSYLAGGLFLVLELLRARSPSTHERGGG
ncbi:MAG: cytochrome c oxidase assembly protein [Myxococcaceae bacterium]